MKRTLAVLAVVAISCLIPGVSNAQDVMVVAKDHYKLLVDNDHVRVVQCTLKPGEKDVMHTHPSNYYFVTQGGKMKVTTAEGKTEMMEMKTGESGWENAEGPHTSENVGKKTLSFILVEVKSAPKEPPK
jgi:quercetin dioxygenase-like cupin family protein